MKINLKKLNIAPYLLVLISFFIVIMVGAFFLVLPISYVSNTWGNFMTAVFTSTSAVCVTGLSVISVGKEFSLFGQIVLMILIQIGGLGFITIFMFIITIFGKKLGFYDRYNIQRAINLNSFKNIGTFVKRVIFITFIIETIGMLCYLGFFIPYCGEHNLDTGKAILFSFFHSVSAFNNAGFDILGGASFEAAELSNSIYLNLVTMSLIITGGLGFLAYIDIFTKKRIKLWGIYTKIVLIMTSTLILFSFVFFLIFENGNMTPLQALFQSVTPRTAGFSTFPQKDLSQSSSIFTCILMFIGASPLSTGGGVKTTTIFIIVYTIIRFISGKQVDLFNRRISNSLIVRSMALVLIALIGIFTSFFIIELIETNNAPMNALINGENGILFECFSAFGTVGLSTGITPYFSIGSQIILCLLMFFGRLGPMTIISIFSNAMNKEEKKHYSLIEADILIG